MKHEEYEELAALYALRALDMPERESFAAHLATGCAACQSSVREARDVSDELALSIDPVDPPARVRERLFEKVRNDTDKAANPTGPKRNSYVYWAALATAASLVVATGFFIQTRSRARELDAETSSRLRLEEELAGVTEIFEALSSPRNRAVSLDAQPAAPRARASAFLDSQNGRLFLYVENLDPLPPGQTYQIWLIVDGTPVSAGIFDVQPDGSARLNGEPLPGFEGTVTVAVTVEPEGGVPQPTGPMVLLGS